MKKQYVFLWVLSTGYCAETHSFSDENKKPITACGSDSIIQIDGRLSNYNKKLFAENWARQRKGIGYSIGYLECHDPNEMYSQSVAKYTKL
jgi:hypothetical protein